MSGQEGRSEERRSRAGSTGTSRDQILSRIRAATGTAGSAATGDPLPGVAGSAATGGALPGVAGSGRADGRAGAAADVDAAYAALPRGYLRAHHGDDVASLFAERAADYRAVVERVSLEPDLPAAVAQVLAGRGGPILVPEGLPAEWLSAVPAGIELAADEPPLSAAALDQMAGTVTGCAVAIAETGTIILDHGPGQGRRALTLVPDFHLVIVRADQVAADLADAFARLDPARPHTLISGPSATSDIELIRVEGVHGPRQLHVLLVGLTAPG